MRIRRPDEPTRQGTYRWYGWLVAYRPRLLRLASIFPAPSSTLISLRAIVLYAVSLPATSLAILIGVAVEGERFSILAMVAGIGWAIFQALGFITTLWVTIAAVLAFRVWRYSSKLDENIPWSAITFLLTFTFVVWPVVTSPYGRFIIPAIWAGELAAGATIVPVRTWRVGWMFRRRWPMIWTIIDNTTANVQASFGGGISAFFARSKALPRPVLNHPAMSPVMEIGYGFMIFWVHAPNGQRLDQLLDLEQTLVENIDPITSVTVSVPPRGSSWAQMRIGIIHDDSILEGIEEDINAELFLVPEADDMSEDEAIEIGEVA